MDIKSFTLGVSYVLIAFGFFLLGQNHPPKEPPKPLPIQSEIRCPLGKQYSILRTMGTVKVTCKI